MRAGLTSEPKWLSPKWLYDERGSELFDQITRLDEYYPTRREREILIARADEIVAAAGADTLVELGSGTSEKTRLLLDAMARAGTLLRFVPFDVSEATLRQAAAAVASEYPGVEVHAVVGDFQRHLDRLPRQGSRMIAFLGGTIGNLFPAERVGFLRALASGMTADDSLLLGTDLVKDPKRLVAAYDDPAGVTAAFTTNLLARLNGELQADFDLARFEHVARYDPENEWVDISLRSRADQTVTIRALSLRVAFASGELLRLEISAKFRRSGVQAELADAGLELGCWWTDDAGDFGVSLSRSV